MSPSNGYLTTSRPQLIVSSSRSRCSSPRSTATRRRSTPQCARTWTRTPSTRRSRRGRRAGSPSARLPSSTSSSTAPRSMAASTCRASSQLTDRRRRAARRPARAAGRRRGPSRLLGAGRLHRHDHGRCRTRRLRPSRRGARGTVRGRAAAAIVELQSRLAKLIAAANPSRSSWRASRRRRSAARCRRSPATRRAPPTLPTPTRGTSTPTHCSCRRRRGPTHLGYPNRAPGSRDL